MTPSEQHEKTRFAWRKLAWEQGMLGSPVGADLVLVANDTEIGGHMLEAYTPLRMEGYGRAGEDGSLGSKPWVTVSLPGQDEVVAIHLPQLRDLRFCTIKDNMG